MDATQFIAEAFMIARIHTWLDCRQHNLCYHRNQKWQIAWMFSHRGSSQLRPHWDRRRSPGVQTSIKLDEVILIQILDPADEDACVHCRFSRPMRDFLTSELITQSTTTWQHSPTGPRRTRTSTSGFQASKFCKKRLSERLGRL